MDPPGGHPKPLGLPHPHVVTPTHYTSAMNASTSAIQALVSRASGSEIAGDNMHRRVDELSAAQQELFSGLQQVQINQAQLSQQVTNINTSVGRLFDVLDKVLKAVNKD